MHFMESTSRVEYARTLAGVVVLDAIKTARDVLAATGADDEQLNQEVDWTFDRAKRLYNSNKPAKDNPEQYDWNWGNYIQILEKVHHDAHNCAEKLAKKLAHSPSLEKFFTKELKVRIPDVLANIIISKIDSNEKLNGALAYAKKPDQGTMKFAYRVAKFNENFNREIYEEAALLWTFAKDGTLTKLEGTEEYDNE